MSNGRVALVTGAARGIGAATAQILAAEGWSVLALDRCADDPALPYPLATPADLDEVVASAPDQIRSVVSRRPRPARARRGSGDGRDHLGRPGRGHRLRWGARRRRARSEVPLEQERAVLAVDLEGVLNLARVTVPALLRRPEPRQGRFLAVSSTAATRGLPSLAAYCAAKAGVCGLVRALAVELGAPASPPTRSAPARPPR